MTKIEKLCIKWLNDNYNHMEPFIMKEYPDYIFHMKDGKCILQYNKKNGYVYVSYKEIWKFFELYFSMSNQQIKDITKIWVEEHYKVGITSTTDIFFVFSQMVEEHYKVGVATTYFYSDSFDYLVEEHYKVGVTKTGKYQLFQNGLVEEQYKMGVKSTQEFGWRLQKEVDEQYKMGVTKTTTLDKTQQEYSVEKHYKMGVKSTMVDYKEITNQVEEQYEVGVKITTTPLSSIYKVEEQYKQI